MCKISLSVYQRQSSNEQKMMMRPDFHIHSKPMEYTKPTFTPKYEYVEVAQLIINPDKFDSSKVTMVTEKTDESNIIATKYANKKHTSRIIITEPELENIMKIPIVVRRVVNEQPHSESMHSESMHSESMTYIPHSETYGFDGREHYLTTYSKNTDQGLHDEKYETHLPSIKPVKYKTTYDLLKNTFLNKIMTRFTGANSIRRSYKHIDFSGKGIITKNDLKISLNMLGIYLITDDDFNLLYLELAGQPNKTITYIGFKNYIDKNM